MRKRYIIIMIILIVIVLIAANSFVENKYKIDLFDYFKYIKGFSVDEKELLSEEDSLIYSSDRSSPPMRFMDPQDGQYKGGVIDYMNSLSVEIGVEIDFKPLVWKEVLGQLKKGKTDISDMFYSEKRAEDYLFTDPVYLLRSVLLVKRGNENIGSLTDISNKKVAMQKKDYAVDYVRKKIGDSPKYFFVDNIEQAINLLIQEKVDAVIGDEPVVTYFSSKKNLNNKLRIINPPLYEKYIRLAVPKDNKELIPILNKGIFALRRKGIMEGIQQKWFGLSGSIINKRDNSFLHLLLILGLGLIVVTIVFFIWNFTLNKKISQRTKELEYSKNKLQTIFDGIRDLMVVINEDYQIENANKAFCKYIELNRKEIIGKKCSKELIKSDKKNLINYCIDERVAKTFSDRKSREEEISFKNKIFRLNIFPIYISDDLNRKHILIVFRDITKELLNEKKLFHANKMAAIGQLAAGMAHEIRNPLGLIRNYTYLIKNKVKNKNNDIKDHIKNIEEAIEKISRIIDNLLNTSHSGNDQKQWINIYDFIERLIDLHANLMDNIDCRIEGKKDIECYINKDILDYILFNLISNAVDAIPDKGNIDIKFKKKDERFFISIFDNGTGIDKADVDSIFNPFFTTKSPGKGTGLGLYIVYNEVEKLQGDINVESSDKGTIFEIALPIKVRR